MASGKPSNFFICRHSLSNDRYRCLRTDHLNQLLPTRSIFNYVECFGVLGVESFDRPNKFRELNAASKNISDILFTMANEKVKICETFGCDEPAERMVQIAPELIIGYVRRVGICRRNL